MNEMSIESLMSIGTGLTAPKSVESKTDNIQFDGFLDGVELNLARTSEQLHFVDTYDKLQALHSAEKMRMVKKIQTAYKNIGNTNVSNSVESYCNNAMSTEGIKEAFKAFKDKVVAFFKKIAEFFKNLVAKIFGSKIKGKAADELKTSIEEDHNVTAVVIEAVEQTSDDAPEAEEFKESVTAIEESTNLDRECFMELMSSYKDSFELLRLMDKNKEISIPEIANAQVVDTDIVEKHKNKLPKKFVAALDALKAKIKSVDYTGMKKQLVETVKTKGTAAKQGISAIVQKFKEFVKNGIASTKQALTDAHWELKYQIQRLQRAAKPYVDAAKEKVDSAKQYIHDKTTKPAPMTEAEKRSLANPSE
jgi:ribosomal protein S6